MSSGTSTYPYSCRCDVTRLCLHLCRPRPGRGARGRGAPECRDLFLLVSRSQMPSTQIPTETVRAETQSSSTLSSTQSRCYVRHANCPLPRGTSSIAPGSYVNAYQRRFVNGFQCVPLRIIKGFAITLFDWFQIRRTTTRKSRPTTC